MHRALFVCGQNKLRSPTAEHVFLSWENVETDSAGLRNDAIVKLSMEQINWATIIFTMEKTHQKKLNQNFKKYLHKKRVICLDIPDRYDFLQPELIDILKKKAGPFLR